LGSFNGNARPAVLRTLALEDFQHGSCARRRIAGYLSQLGVIKLHAELARHTHGPYDNLGNGGEESRYITGFPTFNIRVNRQPFFICRFSPSCGH